MTTRASTLCLVTTALVALLGVHCGDAPTDANTSTNEGVSAATSVGPIHPHASSALCLDVVGQGTANGTAVQIWACSGNANQHWTYDGASLRVYGSKCLDVTGGSTTDGTRLQIWDCTTGNRNQMWTSSGSTFQWTGEGKCLDLTGGAAASGTPIQSWACAAGNPNQEWSFGAGTPGGSSSGGSSSGGSSSGGSSSSGSSSGGGTPSTRVVAYLPNYSGSYASWARTIDFRKITHLNLAFATANGGNGWDMGASDADVAALVTAAHAAGTRVLASLGGGGGDQSVIAQFKNAGNVPALVSNLDAFVLSHGLDGVDIDIEDAGHLGADYATFVNAVVARLRPEGKLVTAAVAEYLQGSMQDATLHTFDFVNVMIYSTYADSVAAMTYYTNTKSVPPSLVTLGAGFFGGDSGGNEYAYSDILAADPGAWAYDQTQVNGKTVNYTGMASMKKLADYAKGFGGIMFWELSEDTTDAHSLYKVIQGEM
jgi:chitinase